MSKKSRRQRMPNLPPEAFHAPKTMPTQPGAAPARAAAVSTPSHPSAPVGQANSGDWTKEYGAVLGDLKRTAILATILLAAMVALSFVVR